jgi:hypothetical protein
MEEIWRTISGTALLSRPLNEPWQEIQPAIRRLLFRYHYGTNDQRADAHREARKFVEIWADRQSGKEQAIGVVECLWHEAAALLFGGSSDLEEVLFSSARAISGAIRPSAAYTTDELRNYAAGRMAEDEEFRKTVSDDPLFNRLIEIVCRPGQR